MSPKMRKGEYRAALREEAQYEAERAHLLFQAGITQRIAQFVDESRRGIHLDINGRCGELAILIAKRTGRKVIALMRNPTSALNAARTIVRAGVSVEPHIHTRLRSEGGSLSLGYDLSINDMMNMDMGDPRAVAVVCDSIRTTNTLVAILRDAQVESITWSFPTMQERICAAEFPELSRNAALHVATLEREFLMRYATLRMSSGSQLIVAGDARIEAAGISASDAEEAQNTQHKRMMHWQPYWDSGKAFAVRRDSPWEEIGQESDHFNGVSILEYRRNNTPIDAAAVFGASNKIIGIE